MTDEQTAPQRRRRGRPPGSASATRASGTRRRRLQGQELVDSLNEMVDALIKENRRLRRELDRLMVQGGSSDSSGAERDLRSLHRKVQRAVTPATSSRRRKGASNGAGRRGRGSAASAN